LRLLVKMYLGHYAWGERASFSPRFYQTMISL